MPFLPVALETASQAPRSAQTGPCRALPGVRSARPLSPYISSPTPPVPLASYLFLTHTPPYILFYDLAFGVSNRSFKVPVKE